MTTNMLNLASTQLVLGQMNPYVINLLVGAFLLISLVMILIVLIQRPQGGGLGGAFGAGGGGGGGGGGAGQTAFGTKTGDVLTGGTIAIFVLFVVFAVILNFATRPPSAQPAQPTIASPVSTEPIPVEEGQDAVDEAAEMLDEAVVDEAVDDAAADNEDAVQKSLPEVDPETDPETTP